MLKALFPLYLANLREFERDRVALFWTFAFPIAFIFIFGLVFGGSNNTTFNIGLVTADSGLFGTGLAKAFQSVGAFKITEGTQAEILTKLKHGDLRAAVVIPQGLSQAASSGQPTKLDVYYDPSNQTTTQVVLTIIERVVEGYDQQMTHRPALVTVSPQSVIASDLSSIDFLLPGIVAMSLMQLGLFATANVLVELREQQVLRRLGATPLTNLVQFPMLFLSGIFIPIEVMPQWLRPVVNIIPLTYLADMLRQVMVGATPAFPISLDLGIITAWLVVCSVLALKFFRWE